MSYTIIDSNHIINGFGTQEMSIRLLSQLELEKLKQEPTTSSWYNPSIQVYTTQYSIDVKAYFENFDWTEKLTLWLTESLEKWCSC